MRRELLERGWKGKAFRRRASGRRGAAQLRRRRGKAELPRPKGFAGASRPGWARNGKAGWPRGVGGEGLRRGTGFRVARVATGGGVQADTAVLPVCGGDGGGPGDTRMAKETGSGWRPRRAVEEESRCLAWDSGTRII